MYQKTHKLNKPVAGYHMLLMLSEIDGEFPTAEGQIIVAYLEENFPFRVNLDEEIQFLSTLPKQYYEEHFDSAMNDFYEDSTADERNHFLDFAVQLVKADDVITKEENIYLNKLFAAWAPEFE
ncbi:MAG: TerB family tellurite resistance protein [Bacteroidia bacterium]|nr:TerB family tellurite resistance protein [Bacteroidia bacterium]